MKFLLLGIFCTNGVAVKAQIINKEFFKKTAFNLKAMPKKSHLVLPYNLTSTNMVKQPSVTYLLLDNMPCVTSNFDGYTNKMPVATLVGNNAVAMPTKK